MCWRIPPVWGLPACCLPCLICMEHPQFKRLPAQHGVYEVREPFLFHIQSRSITARRVLDPQHWLTIVTRVLSNNLGMLGGILSRLTGM